MPPGKISPLPLKTIVFFSYYNALPYLYGSENNNSFIIPGFLSLKI
jgi:hypothetical protein